MDLTTDWTQQKIVLMDPKTVQQKSYNLQHTEEKKGLKEMNTASITCKVYQAI